jgi:predicted nucleic-acid-binding Zn-ribbon protein
MNMNRIEAIRSHFCCPKCRGQSAQVDQATLPLTGGRFFPLKPGRFLVVTCTLCGYTEFYDLTICAESLESEGEPAKIVPSVRPQTSH